MPTAHEYFSDQFHRWERRGRGGRVFETPVHPEPPFAPLSYRPMTDVIDDGRRQTFLGSLARMLAPKPAPEPAPEPDEEPEPTPLVRGPLVELQASLPDKLDASGEAFGQLLLSLSLCLEPIAFEILGAHGKVAAQFVGGEKDAPLLRRQLHAHFPEAQFLPVSDALQAAWSRAAGAEAIVVEFGLAREFMLPLATCGLDPFVGIVGALAELGQGELGLFQVIWQPVRNPWARCIHEAIYGEDGEPIFADAPELASGADSKVSTPLYAAIVRLAACAGDFDRALQMAEDLAGSLRAFADPAGNELVPLGNDGYPIEAHIEDLLTRQTRRSGMILNADELTGLAHLPSSSVRSPAFQRQTAKTKAAPSVARQREGLLLGENVHAGEATPVRLSADQRVRHTHIIGASGTGKSTLLLGLIRQAIEGGEGVAVMDPHGDLIDGILGLIPPSRIDDVILIDPADPKYSVGFNILSAHSELERNLLASDLVATFQRLSTSWGDQMNSVLQNAILAFLESDRRGTVADLRRFLIEPAYRSDFLKSVTDPEVVYYWQRSFPHLSGGKSIGPILTRLDTFLSQRPIRLMVSQPENRIDFAGIMDGGGIFLARLPEGLLGRENSHLLGSLLVSKFQQTAMARQAQSAESRRLFSVFIDEFANFITPSMAEILSGARKYRIGLTLAHHELHQLQRSPDVASAAMAHPCTRVVFRVGDDDARKLAEGFSSFDASDIRNLGTGRAIVRIERSDFDFNLSVPLPSQPDAAESAARREEVITASRRKYGTPRAEVEAMLATSRRAAPSSEPAEKPAQIAPETESPGAMADVPPPPPAIFLNPEPGKAIEAPKPKEPSRDLGRGGAQHRAIQHRLKAEAEKLGFLASIEREITNGSVDLLVERAGLAIAAEISVTTTTDHEVGNVQKCLQAGFAQVAVVCTEGARSQKIRAAVIGSLGEEASKRVGYFSPDEFIAHLNSLGGKAPKEPPAKASGAASVRRGYKVTRKAGKLDDDERRAREEAAIAQIAALLKRRPGA